MELKSYSVFHIGVKINPKIDINEFRSILKDFALVKGYTFPDKEDLNINDIFSRGFNPGVEIIAEKGDTKIEFNLTIGAINFIGKDPKEVSDLVKEAIEFLEAKNYELDKVIDFFEIIATAYFENDKSPAQILKEKTSFDVTKLSQMGDADVNMVRIKGRGAGEEDALDITIGINPLKPSKEFIIQIVKRDRETEKVYKFHELIKETIESLINE